MPYEIPEGVTLGALPWRQWGVPCCPGGTFLPVWSDRRGDNITKCSVCGKHWRHDSSD